MTLPLPHRVSSPADHPPANEPCGRCGTFAPLDRRLLCSACVERLVHPLVLGVPTVGSVLAGVLWLLREVGLPSALLVALVDLPFVLLDSFRELPFSVGSAYGAVVSVVGTGAAVALAQRRLAGEERPSARAALLTSTGRWGSLFGANLRAGLTILAYLLLLLVPGILKGLSLALVTPLVIAGEPGSGNALEESEALMKGHRDVAAASYLLALIPFAALLVALGSAAVIAELIEEGGADQVEWIAGLVGGLLSPVCMLPVAFVSVVLHAQLRRSPSSPAARTIA